MKIFPISIGAVKTEHDVQNFRHGCFMVKAVDEAEATEKANAIALRVYPIKKGWTQHSVVVGDTDNIINKNSRIKVTMI